MMSSESRPILKSKIQTNIAWNCDPNSACYTAVLQDPRRLDFINWVSHDRRLRICSIWGCPDLQGHHGIARRMPVSYSGPREDVSLKALGGYAPSALQTDILPRSSRRQLQSCFTIFSNLFFSLWRQVSNSNRFKSSTLANFSRVWMFITNSIFQNVFLTTDLFS